MQPTILDFLINFSSVLWEAMPFIVLGAIVAGCLEEFLPQELLTRFLPKSVVPAVIIGGLLGLAFPMCECGIVVVMRRLLRKGLPLSCCITYMLAGPIVNLVVIFSTVIAFKDHTFNGHKIGLEMVSLRVGLGFIVACITGLIVQVQYRKYGNSLLTATAMPPSMPTAEVQADGTTAGQPAATPRKRTFMDRLGNISATALHDFVDITVFLILGAVLAPTAAIAAAFLGGYLLLRIAMGLTVGVWGVRDETVRRKWWLIPLRDAIHFIVWLVSFTSRRIQWGGTEFIMHDKEMTISKSAQ